MDTVALLHHVCLEREEDASTIFRRAYHWYYGGDSPHTAGQHYVAFEKSGQVPDFVLAYCNALMPKERQEQVRLNLVHI